MHSKVDPAALLVAVLTVGIAPLTTDGAWDPMNTLIALVVGLVVVGFTWPRMPLEEPPKLTTIGPLAVVYGFIFGIAAAWPIQSFFFTNLNSSNATWCALAVGGLAALPIGWLIWRRTKRLYHENCTAEQSRVSAVHRVHVVNPPSETVLQVEAVELPSIRRLFPLSVQSRVIPPPRIRVRRGELKRTRRSLRQPPRRRQRRATRGGRGTNTVHVVPREVDDAGKGTV